MPELHSVQRPLSFLPFCVPTLVEEPPAGQGWIHEIKHDGYRTMIVVQGGEARAFSRNGHDWSDRYRPVIRTASKLICRSAILDGEMIVQCEDGRSDFEALSAAIGATPERLVFFPSTCSISTVRISATFRSWGRRLMLRGLLPKASRSPIQYSEHVEGDGPKFFEAAEKLGLEGIVSKSAESVYRGGVSKRWLKTKCWTESEFRIVGASGAVGTAAVQIAKHFGATVTGVSSTANLALVRSLGADKVIDYTKEDFAKSGATYDIILDTTATVPLARCEQVLKPGGRLLVVHGTFAQALGMERPSKGSGKKVIAGVGSSRPEDMQLLARLAESGELKPVIDRTYPLESASEAHAYVDTGRKRGSVVLSVRPR